MWIWRVVRRCRSFGRGPSLGSPSFQAWANDPRGREHRVMPRYRRWDLQRWLGLAVAPWFLRKFTNKPAFMHHVAQGGRAGGGIGITSPAPFFQRPRERGAEAVWTHRADRSPQIVPFAYSTRGQALAMMERYEIPRCML